MRYRGGEREEERERKKTDKDFHLRWSQSNDDDDNKCTTLRPPQATTAATQHCTPEHLRSTLGSRFSPTDSTNVSVHPRAIRSLYSLLVLNVCFQPLFPFCVLAHCGLGAYNIYSLSKVKTLLKLFRELETQSFILHLNKGW